MTALDLLIIYLACGAPFGVLRAIQLREKHTPLQLVVYGFRDLLLWPLAAFRILSAYLATRQISNISTTSIDAATSTKVDAIRKKFENILFTGPTPISIYTFRDTFERYAGLSTAIAGAGESDLSPMSELLKISGHKNPELASLCINRRNRSLLSSHQIQTRVILIDALNELADSPETRKKVWLLLNELAVSVEDIEGIADIDKVFSGERQSAAAGHVKNNGEALWKPELQNTPPARQALNLHSSAATMSSSAKD